MRVLDQAKRHVIMRRIVLLNITENLSPIIPDPFRWVRHTYTLPYYLHAQSTYIDKILTRLLLFL